MAQNGPYYIKKSEGPIVIDGVLDDIPWRSAQAATDFYQYFPEDSIPAKLKTEFKLTYDAENMYLAAIMYNRNMEREYVAPSLRRDYLGREIDVITLILDTFQDGTNAFMFGVNPFGSQREGLISNGGNRLENFSLSWDNKWYAEARQEADYWAVEMAIPFKTLRFKDNIDRWNINFFRMDSDTGERTTWSPIRRNYEIYALAFNRELVWDTPLKKSGPNVSFIPYTLAGVDRDFENAAQQTPNGHVAFGGDAKVAISSALNLDMTINPDFSQVEVDEQVTNLDRFEIFFPEKRQFFLENADLFTSFGHPLLARPFFSRKIGIAIDSSTGQNVQNKIHYGARVSGKIDNNWRIGLMNLQTAADEQIDLPATNYSVAAVQRKLFTRSNVGAIFINQQTTRDSLGELTFAPDSYHRLAGVDYNLASADNRWLGKVFYHRSFNEKNNPGQYSHAAYLLYRSRSWQFDWAHVLIGDNFEAPAGFVPRTGIFRINPSLGYFFLPDNSVFTLHELKGGMEIFWNQDRMIDRLASIEYNADFRTTARLETSVNSDYIFLQAEFDPTRTGGIGLPTGSEYNYTYMKFSFSSDFRRLIGVRLKGQVGQYFNGNRLNLNASFNIRHMPFAAVTLSGNYNRIKLPQPYSSANLFLIGPRIDITMTRSLFFTTFVQYNSQINNININSRFQWRFKPVSDLFIVYTDNYGTEDPFDPANRFLLWKKNRALVLKLSYWLNL